MKKRVLSLLVLSILLATAPAAMANHCERCRPLIQACIVSQNFGFDYCEWTSETTCIVGTACGDHTAMAAAQSLASEFQVASVERLDEPQPNTNETRVASLETAPAPKR